MAGYTGANAPTNSSYLDWVPINEVEVHNQSLVTFKHNNEGVVFDNTYRVYKWVFVNLHPATDNVSFQFQVNAEGESGYDEQMTTTQFGSYNKEDNAAADGLGYETSNDQANGTSYQTLYPNQGSGLDESGCGTMYLFDPSSTVFVKQFMFSEIQSNAQDYARIDHCGGYINTTSKINDIAFKFSSGNIEVALIQMYGLPT